MSVSMLFEKGLEAFRNSHLEQSYKYFRTVIDIDEKHSDAHHNIGVIASRLAQFKQAQQYFINAISINRNVEQYWVSIVEAFYRDGRKDLAYAAISIAKLYINNGEKLNFWHLKLQREIQPYVPVDDVSAGILFQLLTKSFDSKMFEGVVREGEVISQILPFDIEVHNIVACANIQLSRFIRAIQILEPVVNNNSNISAIQNLSTAYKLNGDYDKAIALLGQYEDYSNNIDLSLQKADLYIEKNETEKAIEVLCLVLRAKSKCLGALKRIGFIHFKLMQFDSAYPYFRKLLDLDPDDSESLRALVESTFHTGHWEDCLKYCKAYIAKDPTNQDVQLFLGVTYFNIKDYLAAINVYNALLSSNPNHLAALTNLGAAYLKMNKFSEAQRFLTEALRVSPNNPGILCNISVIYKHQGKLKKCYDTLVSCLRIDADHQGAKENLIDLLTIYEPTEPRKDIVSITDGKIRSTQRPFIEDPTQFHINCIDTVSHCLKLLKQYHLDIPSKFTQTYRRNKVNLNCERHMTLYQTEQILSSFCFSCFKVQVKLKNVIELIKLYFLFDALELNENQTRKCMIELRDGVSGTYKGFVYCRDIYVAQSIQIHLQEKVSRLISETAVIEIKRGCSEYAENFANFPKVGATDLKEFKYPVNWAAIEKKFDQNYPISFSGDNTPTMRGLSLNDILIIRNWLDYAIGIKDRDVETIDYKQVTNQNLMVAAKRRVTVGV